MVYQYTTLEKVVRDRAHIEVGCFYDTYLAYDDEDEYIHVELRQYDTDRAVGFVDVDRNKADFVRVVVYEHFIRVDFEGFSLFCDGIRNEFEDEDEDEDVSE